MRWSKMTQCFLALSLCAALMCATGCTVSVRSAYNCELSAKTLADGVIAARQTKVLNDADYAIVWPLCKIAIQKSDDALTQALAGNKLTAGFALSAAESALDAVYQWSLTHKNAVKLPAPSASIPLPGSIHSGDTALLPRQRARNQLLSLSGR